MKRRNFLKLVAAVVICPKGLLKTEPIAKEFIAYCAVGGKLTYREHRELIKKLREAHKNTKFKQPVRHFYFRGVRCYYLSGLGV